MGKRKNSRKKVNLKELILLIILVVIVELISNYINKENYANDGENEKIPVSTISFNLDSIPEYKDTPYVAIDNNVPKFTKSDITINAFEKYSELDSLGRCRSSLCKYL